MNESHVKTVLSDPKHTHLFSYPVSVMPWVDAACHFLSTIRSCLSFLSLALDCLSHFFQSLAIQIDRILLDLGVRRVLLIFEAHVSMLPDPTKPHRIYLMTFSSSGLAASSW